MKKSMLILLALLPTILLTAQNPIVIKPSETRHGPEQGSLVIIGGAVGQTDDIWERFIELAGGKDKARIVVVANASGDTTENASAGLINTIRRRIGNDERVSLLNLRTIAEANNPDSLVALRAATGVFFDGGRQWRIADVYLNTLTHEEFWNVLRRGGVIAGSSAGASIQGSFLWRGDTSGYLVLVGDHTQGLGFLRNSVIDQHLLARNRQHDLVGFMRIAPQFIGIGLDEATAVVVQRDSVEVIGNSYVAFYSAESENWILLRKGQKYDLKEHKTVIPERRENTPPSENDN